MTLLLVLFLLPLPAAGDTCGQDRVTLGDWFVAHGSPSLLEEPIPTLVSILQTDPYLDPSNPPPSPNPSFCAMQWSNNTVGGLRKYRLANFESEDSARHANYSITHRGHCASCSTLQDLGVYMRQNLTSATRHCGMLGIVSSKLQRDCLRDIGFSEECISIWGYNIVNTRKECFWVCIKSAAEREPFNKPDGSLNDCLQCDEDKSGPNFKFFSGRTRRNSGIPSAIKRPDSQVYHMEHCYWYGQL
eukprot:sb/3468922/